MTSKIDELAALFMQQQAKMTLKEIEKHNAENAASDAAYHAEFLGSFRQDICNVCGKALRCFSAERPCLHWLLRPKGFKKKHLPALVARFNFFQVVSYLRYVANMESFAVNINDMPTDGISKIYECTIRYKHLEWSISCGEGDLKGHSGSYAARPHYHLQMRIDGKPFIDFADFHNPLTIGDQLQLKLFSQNKQDNMKVAFPGGEGIGDFLESPEALEKIVNSPVRMQGDESKAAFAIETLMMAREGETFRGDDIYDLMQEARAKGVTFASLIHKLPAVSATTWVSAGPGVVEQATRSGGRGRSTQTPGGIKKAKAAGAKPAVEEHKSTESKREVKE